MPISRLVLFLALALPPIAAGCAGRPEGVAAPAPASGTTAARQPNHPLPAREPGEVRSDKPKPSLVDNQRCFVCHLTYEDEPLVLFHAGGGVSCEKCHGESLKHTNDEDNVIPPDVMYARDQIAAACWVCHPEVKPPRGFKAPVAEDAKKVCTDCHYNHRLPQRQRVWDKRTGKLLSEPPVNPMTGTDK